MFNQGLSLDQAPPIDVPFRFFISAPFFAILIGLTFLVYPFELISNQYSPISISIIHMFTLGILAMIVFGAMQQMMPVLAGSVIKKARLFATIVHISLFFGTLFFCGFFLFNLRVFLYLATICLSISFLVFFINILKLLYKVEYLTTTIKAMRLFSLSGFIVLCLAIYILNSYISNSMANNHYEFVNMHILFGVFGFAILLIMGVSFQVIPMFYVAPNFSNFFQERVPLILFILLIISSFILYLKINFFPLKIIFIAILILFAIMGIKSLNNRKRAVFDVTLWYWKFSLSSLIFSQIIWLFDIFESKYVLAIVFAFGFLYSILKGMVYKIIPFLSWFHLNSKGYFEIPNIREFIDERYIKIDFYLHFIAIIFFVISYFINTIIFTAASIFIFSNVIFLLNMLGAIKKYRDILKTQPMSFS